MNEGPKAQAHAGSCVKGSMEMAGTFMRTVKIRTSASPSNCLVLHRFSRTFLEQDAVPTFSAPNRVVNLAFDVQTAVSTNVSHHGNSWHRGCIALFRHSILLIPFLARHHVNSQQQYCVGHVPSAQHSPHPS